MNLKNKKVLITGATGGIGNCLVKKFDSLNSKIIATGTNEEKLKKIQGKYSKLNTLRFDISDHKNIDQFVEDCNNILSNT